MVKIALAGASGQLAREIIDALVATQKHEIIGLDPAPLPSLPGVTWVKTTYEDKSELVRLLQGVETVMCFFPVHFDPGSATQKRLIDAAVEAGVKRYAPSEWATGTKLETSLDGIPWYAGKVEITRYLEDLNKEKKVIEYTRFQVGAFMNYLGHPHKTSEHVKTLSFLFDFEKQRATLVKDRLDDVVVWTTVQDIAGVVARAVEYEGEWPAIGGITGTRLTVREMLQIGEAIGKPFTIDWLKLEDIEAEERDMGSFADFDLHTASPEVVEAFLNMALKGILLGISRGAYDITDEWNKILPDYKFTQVEDFLKKVWGGK
ncbi:NAD(P)-binding protein [Hypoxylon rubiginosum]|uniref:NAD(P)-binding protein n=1 Tax=Hypoxylon rubiginosum TaxID=110542 RepID=A0ACB9YRI0_9PEZI|nr:NAD(P)-binding protein [Hypoxylon rubiginosum]